MFCKNCGKEIEDDSSFCSGCGYSFLGSGGDVGPKFVPLVTVYEKSSLTSKLKAPFSKLKISFIDISGKHKKNKKVTIIAGSAALLVLIAVVVTAVVMNTPINKFERYLGAGEYRQAVALFKENRDDQEFNKSAISYMSGYLDGIQADFLDDKISSTDALAKVNAIKDIKAVDQVRIIIENITESKKEFKNAEDLYKEGKLIEALVAYKKVDSKDTKNFEAAKGKQSEIIATLKKDALADAKKKADAGDYKGAAQLLTDINITLCDPDITKQHKEYFDVYKKAAVANLKTKITVGYDDIDRSYKIVPKGLSTRYVNISGSRNLDPMVMVHSDVSFVLVAGFQQDDWIFTEKVIIDCDGTQYKYDVAYEDRFTQVMWGGTIAEWVGLFHSDQGLGDLAAFTEATTISDLSPLVESIRSANTVKVRFDGDGYKDVIIPKNTCLQVGEMWDIYQLLKEDPSLINDLK